MKKILVPVDFSKCSLDAFFYANQLAQFLGASVKLIHIYSSDLGTNEDFVLRPGKTKEQTMEILLQEFANRGNENQNTSNTLTKINIETEAIFAISVTNKIIKLTEKEDTLMVVMGTNGISKRIDRIFGSVASAVAQKANCPVLLIPKGTEFKSMKNIMYASNYESIDDHMLHQIIDFGKLFRATLHFVHIEKKDRYETIEKTIFETIFEEGDPAYSFNIVNLKDKPVMEGLNQYAEENNIDVMTLVNSQRSHFNNLFNLSLTRKMALNNTLPLLVFHLS